MKQSNIYIFIYDNYIYLSTIHKKEIIQINNNVFSKGRLNNYKKLFKSIKSSKIIKHSLLKIVHDKLYFIYFGDYNPYELNNIKNSFIEDGFNNISLININDVLSDNEYLLFNNDYYYIIYKGQKRVLPKSLFKKELLFANSTLLVDQNSAQNTKLNMEDIQVYTIDNIVDYIYKKIY